MAVAGTHTLVRSNSAACLGMYNREVEPRKLEMECILGIHADYGCKPASLAPLRSARQAFLKAELELLAAL